MHMEFLAEYGYTGLFLAAFGAATLLPLGSEIVLILLWANAWDPAALLAVATTGNVLGSLVNYAIGIRGGEWLMTKLLRLSPAEITRAENGFKKYGQPVLLLAWLPVVGDPLTVVAGALKVKILDFIFFVTVGKFLRYLFIGITVTQFSF